MSYECLSRAAADRETAPTELLAVDILAKALCACAVEFIIRSTAECFLQITLFHDLFTPNVMIIVSMVRSPIIIWVVVLDFACLSVYFSHNPGGMSSTKNVR